MKPRNYKPSTHNQGFNKDVQIDGRFYEAINKILQIYITYLFLMTKVLTKFSTLIN
jgi:hypothetical protein